MVPRAHTRSPITNFKEISSSQSCSDFSSTCSSPSPRDLHISKSQGRYATKPLNPFPLEIKELDEADETLRSNFRQPEYFLLDVDEEQPTSKEGDNKYGEEDGDEEKDESGKGQEQEDREKTSGSTTADVDCYIGPDVGCYIGVADDNIREHCEVV